MYLKQHHKYNILNICDFDQKTFLMASKMSNLLEEIILGFSVEFINAHLENLQTSGSLARKNLIQQSF